MLGRAIYRSAAPAPEADRLRAVLCDRLRRSAQEPISLPAARDPRLSCASAIAHENLEMPVPLSVLADASLTSERTLSRLFHKELV